MKNVVDSKYWFATGIAVSSIGISYFIKSDKYFSLLFMISGILLIILVMISVLSKKIKYYLNFKINLNADNTKESVQNIFDYARDHGGKLYVTHIFQQRVNIDKDFAVQSFKYKNIKNKLEFSRIFVFTNKKEENDWINSFFELKQENIELIAYFWENIDIKVNNSFVGLLPRFNIVLYESENENVFKCFIGFERVRSKSDFMKNNLNLSLYTESIEIYKAMREYYISITTHPQVKVAYSKEKYYESKIIYPIDNEEQYLIKEILDYAYQSEKVLHIGTFGHTAIILNNLTRIKRKLNYLSDIDLLLIVDGDKEVIKTDLKNKLANDKIEIIFGDNLDYFYFFRKKDKITIDIEIFERDSNFYLLNRLLGYSIFYNYINIYSSDNTPIDELVHIPQKAIIRKDRINITLDNRKSIREFISKLSSYRENQIDLRRVITINTQNINWALTGMRPYDITTILDYLKEKNYISSNQNDLILKILEMSEAEIKDKYKKYLTSTIDILKTYENVLCKEIINL